MNSRRMCLLLVLPVLGLGCGDSIPPVRVGGTGASGGTGGAGATGGTGAAPTEDEYVVKWGPTEVQPGTESTQCVVKRLGNGGSVFINQIGNVLGATSHHFIVYQVDDTVERPEPYSCSPFQGSGSSSKLLMITQKANDLLRFPEGVAYELEPGQMIRLELHFINVSAAPQMAEATSTFGTVAEADVQYRAGIEFLGGGVPTLPPHETSTVQHIVTVKPALEAVSFFAITGHQHKLGTNVFVELVDAEHKPVKAVYDVENFRWDEPATIRHDPAFQIPSGGAFDLTCDWNNVTDDPVGFGTSVDDEMCFFWAYYYQ